MIGNFLWLILVFGIILKRKTLNMTKMIIKIRTRAVGILMFALFPRKIVPILKFAVYFVIDIDLNIKQSKENVNFSLDKV